MKTRLVLSTVIALAVSGSANAQILSRLLDRAAEATATSLEYVITDAIHKGIEKSYEKTERKIEKKMESLCRTNILLTDYNGTGRSVILCSEEDPLNLILYIKENGISYQDMLILSKDELKKFKKIERVRIAL